MKISRHENFANLGLRQLWAVIYRNWNTFFFISYTFDILSLDVKEYCETEIFNATCHKDELLLMTHARYGRMRVGRCVKLDYGHVGCAADVLEIADAQCSGRQQCIMPIPDTALARTKPCPDDLKPYFEATFLCIKGKFL